MAISGNALQQSFFSSLDPKVWIHGNIRKRDNWSTIFANMIWQTWKVRNRFAFDSIDDHFRLSSRVCSISQAFWSTSESLMKVLGPISPLQQQDNLVSWRPHSGEWITVNTDAVSKGNPGLAGGAGLARDSTGKLIGGLTFKCGRCEALTAELWALFYGVKLVLQLGFRLCSVELTELELKLWLELELELLTETQNTCLVGLGGIFFGLCKITIKGFIKGL